MPLFQRILDDGVLSLDTVSRHPIVVDNLSDMCILATMSSSTCSTDTSRKTVSLPMVTRISMSHLYSARPTRIRARVSVLDDAPARPSTLLQSVGQHYHIPPDPAHPKIDCYDHLNRWMKYLSSILGRALTGIDYIFPAIASTDLVKFGEPTSRSGIEMLLELIVEKSGVMMGRNGKFTTHCFRRGGAQYRFMWAERKWSLKAVKWWGGWSSSEHVHSI